MVRQHSHLAQPPDYLHLHGRRCALSTKLRRGRWRLRRQYVQPTRTPISILNSALLDAINPVTITPVHGKYPAIIHYSGLPTKALVGSINGLLSGVLAYAGAQLFVEFMAEMRRPRDFLKV